jgi:TonB dependent receptor
LFVQDDWKLTPTLTVNLGLRWDYETPRTERYNRMVRGFGFGQANPLASQVSGLDLTGGLLYAGSSGDSRLSFNPDKKHIEPRGGVAWRFAPKWVMRAGYGLAYLGQSANGANTGFSQPTSLVASTDGGLTPAVSLSNPFPTTLFPTGLLQPIGSSRGLATNVGQSISAQYMDRPLPYSHQYSFGFQHELKGGWLVDASYSGNVTRRLPVSLGLNFLPASALNSMPVAARAAYFTAAVPNPMAGLLPSSSINGATVPRQQLLYAYPEFTGVSITNVPIGASRYDSFQSKVTHRFSHGLAMQGSFTISKSLEQVSTLNAQDVNLNNLQGTPLEKRLTAFDAPRAVSIVSSYELPFGKGRRFGRTMRPLLNGIAGGWNVNAQWTAHSGYPFSFPNAAPLMPGTANLHDSQRDSMAQKAGRTQWDPSYDPWFNTALFPTQAQAPFTLRDFPTMFPDVRSKILNVWDISVYKEFPIKERVRWQVRTDFHNAFNHPWFGNLASNNVTNSQFGQVSVSSIDDTSEPRLIVLVMKIVF